MKIECLNYKPLNNAAYCNFDHSMADGGTCIVIFAKQGA